MGRLAAGLAPHHQCRDLRPLGGEILHQPDREGICRVRVDRLNPRQGSAMRLRFALLFATLTCMSSGCGTLVNLTAPATSFPGTDLASCTPFGGVKRSLLLGTLGTGLGMLGSCEEGGVGGSLLGAGCVSVGLVALFIDTPLSFAGDVLTLPIVLVRQQTAPWAPWWSEPNPPVLPSQEGPPQDPTQGPLAPQPISPPAPDPVSPSPRPGS